MVAVGAVSVGADDVVVGAASPLPDDELELPEDPLEDEPLECEPLEPLEEEPEPEFPSGLTYWLSPAEAPPPPWARVTAGAARASTPRTPRHSRNWRHAVIR